MFINYPNNLPETVLILCGSLEKLDKNTKQQALFCQLKYFQFFFPFFVQFTFIPLKKKQTISCTKYSMQKKCVEFSLDGATSDCLIAPLENNNKHTQIETNE